MPPMTVSPGKLIASLTKSRNHVLMKSDHVQQLSNKLLHCEEPEAREKLYERMRQSMQEYFRDLLKLGSLSFQQDIIPVDHADA